MIYVDGWTGGDGANIRLNRRASGIAVNEKITDMYVHTYIHTYTEVL